MTRRRGDPIRPSPRRPEELNPLPGVTGEPVEKSYGSGNTGGLFVDPGDGTIGHAGHGQGDQAQRSRATGADAAPVDTSPGDAATGGLTGDVGQQDPARRSSGSPIAGGVAVNPGRGSDLGTIGPTTRDDLGGGLSGGTTGGLRERDTGGGLSGDMHNDMGSGRAPDLDVTAGAPEQRRVGTEDDDDS